jgi:F0F1-type ATP synthase delta subunit
MTQIGNVYGESLYELAKDENLAAEIGGQLKVLKDCFA